MTRKTISTGIAMLLLVSLGLLGLYSGSHEASSAETPGQWIATGTHLAYALLGLFAVGGLLTHQPWVRVILILWGAAVTATAGLAPVVWGGAGTGAGLLGGVVGALIAGLVMWLARPNPSETLGIESKLGGGRS